MLQSPMNILLYAPQDFTNFASVIRILDFFGFHKMYVVDTNSLVKPMDDYSRGMAKRLRKVSSGAIDYVKVQVVLQDFFSKWSGRVIFTAAETVWQRNERLQNSPNPEKTLEKNPSKNPKWVDLYHFAFESEDLLVFGSEASGLPKSLLQSPDLADFVLTLPTRGSVDSLNLAMSVGVFLSEAARQGVVDFSENPLFVSKKEERLKNQLKWSLDSDKSRQVDV